MRRMAAAMFVLFLAVLDSGGGTAGDVKGDEPYPVDLAVGETFKVCLSGELVCPATSPICDDLKVVDVVDTPDGMGFVGIAPGSTLCSALGGNSGFRRVFRITVHQP